MALSPLLPPCSDNRTADRPRSCPCTESSPGLPHLWYLGLPEWASPHTTAPYRLFFFSYLLLDPSLSSFSTPGSQLTCWDTSVCLLWSCHLLFTPNTVQFWGKGMPVEGNYFPLSPDMPLTTLLILIIFLPLARPSFWGAEGQSTLPRLMQRLFHSKLYIKPHTNKKIPEASSLWEK